MNTEELFRYYINFSGSTVDEVTWRDSSAMIRANVPLRKVGKTISVYQGRVIAIKGSIFTAEIEDEEDVYQVNIQLFKLQPDQRVNLAVGAKFEWRVRHDYSNNKKRTKGEIYFTQQSPKSENILREMIEENKRKYGHFFRNEEP